MATYTSAWFLRQLRGNSVLGRYQNHWPGALVTWESVPWAPLAFDVGAMSVGDATAEGGARLTMAFDPVNWERAREAQAQGDFWELKQYRFDSTAAVDDGPPVSMTLWSGFIGQVAEVNMDGMAQIDLALGSVLSPVSVKIPPRVSSTDLIGVPLRL